MNSKYDVKKLPMDFLLDCAFGQHNDLVTASIDKAYVDMASHTLTIFEEEDYMSKWAQRFRTTAVIRDSQQDYPNKESMFAEWHKCTISKIVKEYGDKLSEGQAQKWLKMTIKYIFIIKEVFRFL